MRLFLGTIIVIISMLIIAFSFWYYHYHMVAFGRGLLEALPSERMIAFTFTSIPFMASIYLALRHLIFESHGRKRRWNKKKWSTAEIACAFVCLAIFWFFVSNFVICLYYVHTQAGTASACDRMEVNAQNTAAALADYFADPEKNAVPSADQLVEEVDLLTNFPVNIEEDDNGMPIITVFDDKTECRKGNKYILYMGGAVAEWKD